MSHIQRYSGRWPASALDISSMAWKCRIGLLLVMRASIAHSFDAGDYSRNVNINDYCGKDWTDAFNTCSLACPNGKDSECAELGEDYTCQSFTMCQERLENGIIVAGLASNTPAPKKNPSGQPTPSPTAGPAEPAVAIEFPMCPPEYDVGSDYGLGNLLAYPIDGSTMKEVYSCQGEQCNAGPHTAPGSDNAHLNWNMVGTCPHAPVTTVEPTQVAVETTPTEDTSSTTTDPTQGSVATTVGPLVTGLKWWLDVECVYGDGYLYKYDITKVELVEAFIFDTEGECCTKFTESCINTTTIATDPPVPTFGQPTMSPSTSPGATSAPTISPSEIPTFYDSEMPTGGSTKMHGQSLLFGITTIFMAFLAWA